MKMSKMKWVDKWLGLVLCAALAPLEYILPKKRSKENPSRILVIKFWGMGSIIMASYLLEKLRNALPEGQITLLTLESNREIAKLTGAADRIETLDISRGPLGIISNIFTMLWKTYRAGYDVVLDLEYLTRFTALVTFASRSPVRAGFFARGFWRGNFHNHKAPFNPYWHTKDNFLNQASIVGIDGDAPECVEINPGIQGQEEADKLLKELDISSRYVIINPNAGETSLERRWPSARFAELAGRIDKELNLASLVVGARKEWDVAQEVVKGSGSSKVINVAGRTTVRGLVALLKHSAAVVSNDSGPLHLASHSGAKVVGLFGPETPALWGPLGRDARNIKVFFRDLDCSPCINIHNMKTVTCLREGAECLTDISVGEVFTALKELLADKQD